MNGRPIWKSYLLGCQNLSVMRQLIFLVNFLHKKCFPLIYPDVDVTF